MFLLNRFNYNTLIIYRFINPFYCKGMLMKKTVLSLITLFLLTACAQGVDAAKRLETCVVDGNENGNCEISTLEGNK